VFVLFVLSSLRFFTNGFILVGWSFLREEFFLFGFLGFWWFIMRILNMGVPPSLRFFSEVIIIVSLGSYYFFGYLVLGVLLFFSGVYGIYMFVVSMHGESFFSSFYGVSTVREYLLVWGHFFPVFLLTLFVSFLF